MAIAHPVLHLTKQLAENLISPFETICLGTEVVFYSMFGISHIGWVRMCDVCVCVSFLTIPLGKLLCSAV